MDGTTHAETSCGETAYGEYGMSVRKTMLQDYAPVPRLEPTASFALEASHPRRVTN